MKDKILKYIEDNLLESTKKLSSDDDLLNTGLVDSIGVVKLIAFIEDEYHIKVPPEEMVIENFVTVDAISGFISSVGD